MIDRVDTILGKALAHVGLGRASDIRRLMDAWKQTVGERIAAQATPLALKGSVLVLAVPDAVWRQELALMTPEIRDRINAMLGRKVVERIRLVSQGAVDPGVSPFRARHRRLPAPAPDSAEDHALPAERDAPPLSTSLQEAFAALERARSRRLSQDRTSSRHPTRK